MLELEWNYAPEWFEQVAREKFGDKEAAIPTSYKRKAYSAVVSEHMERVADNLGICKWLYGIMFYHDVETATRLFNLVTGKDWDVEQLLKVSERARNLERMFDVRQGLLRKNDTLPGKIFDEPLKRGPFKGEVMDREKFEQMKDEYYELRGWDKETGIPKEETLVALGLEDLVNRHRRR